MTDFTTSICFAGICLFGAVAANMVSVYAQVRSKGFSRLWWALLSILAISFSFFCFRYAVLIIPLGLAYALWCVFGIFGTLALGRIFFQQKLSRTQFKAVLMLLVGVVLMSLG